MSLELRPSPSLRTPLRNSNGVSFPDLSLSIARNTEATSLLLALIRYLSL